PLRVGWLVVADVDGGRGALEDVELLRGRAQVRYRLHGGGAGTDDADDLIVQAREVPVVVAAGVGVIPAAGVERVPLEGLDPGDTRQLGPVERAVRHAHILSADAVVAVGGDDPGRLFVIPLEAGDASLEAGVVVQVVVL